MQALNWTVRARLDLRRIYSWMTNVEPDLAALALRAIEQRVELLTEFPRIGTPLLGGVRKLNEPRYGYVILYRLRGDNLDILRIRHAHEDWR